jgi:O-methyltransferase
MKRVIKYVLGRAGYQLSPLMPPQLSSRAKNPDITDREWLIYSKVKPFTMLSLERILANIRAVDHVVRNQILGDIVECGVWRGGSSMAMALALKGQSPRTLWMYDTYAGMTDASSVDISHSGTNAANLLAEAKQLEGPERSLKLGSVSLEDVRVNMAATGYPISRIKFVEGPVEQTIPGDVPGRISLLRIDTDWYASTLHELRHLYPLLSLGGILIIDDYGHWQGARKAVDEYFEDELPFLNRIDYTGRLLVKPQTRPQNSVGD